MWLKCGLCFSNCTICSIEVSVISLAWQTNEFLVTTNLFMLPSMRSCSTAAGMGKHNFPWQVILYIRNNLKYLVVENIITFTLHYYQVPKEENLIEVPILAISLVYIASSYTTAYASWNCRAKTPKKTALRRYENQQNKSDKKTVLLWLQRKNVW